jgi:Amt family ammonium transporter
LVIGGAAGLLCYGAVQLKKRLRYDDVLDVVGVHMVGGFIGVVLTGVFASLAVNAAGAHGGWSQLGRQTALAGAGIVYPFLATWLVLWVTDHLVGLRLSPEEEDVGLDLSEFAGTSSQPSNAGTNGLAATQLQLAGLNPKEPSND